MSREVYPTSVLLHIVPLIAGLYYIRGMNILPSYSGFGAWLLYVIPFWLSWRFADSKTMINLSHGAQASFASAFPNPLAFYSFLLVLTGVVVALAIWAINRSLGRQLQRTKK